MAIEERQMNAYCINNMLSIVISDDIFVGHLGFYTQKDICKKFYTEHIKEL